MTIASRKTATASVSPKSLRMWLLLAAKDPKTTIMTAAAAVITRPVRAMPFRTAVVWSEPWIHSSLTRETRNTS